MSVCIRPQVQLYLSKKDTIALIDTGATRSLMRRDVAINNMKKLGRPLVFKPTTQIITSLTGDTLKVYGIVQFNLDNVGVLEFLVVDNMAHKAIVGYDMLKEHGYRLDEQHLRWGGARFPLLNPPSPQQPPQRPVHAGEVNDQFSALLQKHRTVFGSSDHLRAASLPPLEIHTIPGKVVHKKPYRVPLNKREIIEEEVAKMLRLGVIRPSSSEFASPITLVPKKDGTTRFCVDYRALNSITVKDRYPLPLIQSILDSLAGSTTFSTIDLRTGFWQLPVHPDSVKKTAFVCHLGQYEFLRMPFGLSNAPAFYQRAMNTVLAPYLGKIAMVYLDDIIVFSKSPEEHQHHLDIILQALYEAGLTLKESKCHFGLPQLDLLGYVISGEGISAQPAKTAAIENLPPPQDISALRSFLGMCSYYRQLVPNYADFAEPLHALTRKGQVWHWNQKHQRAFDALKAALVSSAVMAYPQTDRPYILYTDASDYALGAILVQEDNNGIERPIQYVSKQLNARERKWATIEREAYAVVHALRSLRVYLLGSDFVVYTDHKPLLSFFVGEVANTRIQRWSILLSEFNATIRYRPGKNNVRADMLSRIRMPDEAEIDVIDADAEWVMPDDVKAVLPPHVPLLADNIDCQALQAAQAIEFPEEIELAQDKGERFCVIDDILYSSAKPRHNMPQYPRVMLPTEWRDQVIARCHQEVGHQSVWKTTMHVQEHYVWPGMKKDIQKWLDKCGLCQVHQKRPERVAMGEMPLALCPGQYIGVDLIGPLIPSIHSDARYIMTCIDHYSGWVEAYPLKNKTNEAVWERLRNDYVPRHGVPEVMVTDQGSEFKGKDFAEWLKGMGIEHRRTTPYHPQSNGKTERFNKTLKTMLKRLINGQRAHWEDQLGVALYAYRISTSTVTGHTPFMLQYCRPPRAPLTRLLDEDQSRTLGNRLQLQAELMQEAARATADSRRYNRERLARQANARELSVGDTVLLKAREPLSLTAKWDYGFTVTKINGKVITVLHPTTGSKQIVNREQVRLVDPTIAWDEVAPRPRRQQARPRAPLGDRPQDRPQAPHPPAPAPAPVPAPPPQPDQPHPAGNGPAPAPNVMDTAPPADDVMDTDPPTGAVPDDEMETEPVPRLRLKRIAPSDDNTPPPYQLRNKRSRWTSEQVAALNDIRKCLQYVCSV